MAGLTRSGGKQDAVAVARRIDQGINKRLTVDKVPASPLANDAEFLRRAWLDIVGTLPPHTQAAAFLDSNDPDKRRKLIDELLASPEYGRHFGDVWRSLTLFRDSSSTNSLGEQFEFANWMAEKFNANAGWDRIVTELLTASGGREKRGEPLDNPAVAFLLAYRNNATRQAEPELYTGAVAELFLGLGLKCAQCHDHKYVKEWKQTDFYGLAAFFGRVRARGFVNGPATRLSEEDTTGDRMVYEPKSLNPYRSDGAIGIPDPMDPGNRAKYEKLVKARFFEGSQPVLPPQGPYRPALARWLTGPENKYFSRAAVNRLWKHFFGLGLVNPIEDMSPLRYQNSPQEHIELLHALADEFAASGFDQKHLIRCICNSQAYQRTSRPLPDNKEDDSLFSHMAMKVMRPEVLYDALAAAMGYELERGKPMKSVREPRLEFAKFFGGKLEGIEPTDFRYGQPQLLSLLNGPEINSRMRASPILADATKAGTNSAKALDVLFLAALSRKPTLAEAQIFAPHLAQDPKGGAADAFKILLTSAEFMLNH